MDALISFFKDPLVILSQLLYFLESCCYTLLDLAQLMFRLIAGLDTLNGNTVGGDIFYQIINKTFIIGDNNYSVVAVAFWSLIILSCILLFITTIASLIKSEVAVDKDGKLDNSKGKIIFNSIKALLYFAIVPIACYFGLWLGNVVLFVIDEATAPQTTNISSIDADVGQYLEDEDGSYNYYIFWGEARNTPYTSVSGMINKLCLYQANRIRNDDAFFEMIKNDAPPDNSTETTPIEGATYNFGIITQGDPDAAAAVVDSLFMVNAKLKTPQVLNYYDYISGYGNASGKTVEFFDRSDISLVSYFYDMKQYNHILALLFIFTGGKVLLTLSFAAMHRIIMLLARMFVEPITLSFMPLDKGNAFTEWRKSFVSHIISLYVLVFSVNVFYIITPVFQTFTFFGNVMEKLSWADMVVQSAFIIAALMAIQSFEEMFSKFLGGTSIMKSGASTMEALTNTAKTIGGAAMGVAHLGMHAAGAVGHIGAAGIKVGLAGKNAISAHRTKSKMKDYEKGADKSDDQIRRDIVKNRQEAAKKEYNEDIDKAFNDARKKSGNRKMSKEHWLKSDEGIEAVEKNRQKFGGMSEEEYSTSEGNQISEALNTGVAKNEKEEKALRQFDSDINTRNEERRKYDELKEKHDERVKRAKARLSGTWTSVKKTGGSFLGALGDVGGMAGSGGKKK